VARPKTLRPADFTVMTTAALLDVRHDLATPADRSQTFLLGFWPPVDGSLTYTEPVTVCGEHRVRTHRGLQPKSGYPSGCDLDGHSGDGPADAGAVRDRM
jgi:hypothetical protein